jgi:hypothetical protein
MSWVSENKFLTGFGVVMLAGVGTLGYFTYAAMDKYDAATGKFDGTSAQLKKLQDAKPSLTDANLKELLAQKQELAGKIADLQKVLKDRVLPLPAEAIKPAQFQDKLKETVAQITSKAAAAQVELPKNFYLGFDKYQSSPPNDAAAPLLERELHAVDLVMNVFIKTTGIEMEKFDREPLPEESGGGKKRGGADRSDRGQIEASRLSIKFTSSDGALRKILTDLANHKDQLFIIRNMSVQNKQTESPPRVGAGPQLPPVPATPEQPAPGPAAPAVPAAPAAPAPATPPPAAPAPPAHTGPLAYVFGTEKISTILELEVLNIEEPKPKSEKPEKGGKKKEK